MKNPALPSLLLLTLLVVPACHDHEAPVPDSGSPWSDAGPSDGGVPIHTGPRDAGDAGPWVPSAPRDVHVEIVPHSASVVVHWSAPEYTGPGGLTGYTVSGNGGSYVAAHIVSPSSTSYTLDVQGNGSVYTSLPFVFSVQASNDAGTGPAASSEPTYLGDYLPPVSYPVGTHPRQVLIVDVNHDGQLDLVTANEGGDLSLLLGHGDGGFEAARSIPVGAGAMSVVAVDVNGDGWLDLASSNSGSGTVSVLLGSDAGFTSSTNWDAGRSPSPILSGDLNEDGDQDLVVMNYGAGTVSVLLNQDGGNFPTAQPFVDMPPGASGVPFSMALGDLNEDGHIDLVTTSGSILLGDGLGNFALTSRLNMGGMFDVHAIDLNHDGHLDLIFAGDPMHMELGFGDGGFRDGGGIDSYLSYSITFGDFDKDGFQDIALGDKHFGFDLFYGEANGTYSTGLRYALGGEVSWIATADLNGDGRLDFVVVDYFGQVSIVLHK